MTNDRLNYTLVGSFVLAAIIGLVAAVALLTGRTGATDEYFTVYDNVTGIEFGTRVLFEGFPIGQIEKIQNFDDGGTTRFRVTMSVQKGWRIPADSVAEITASGILASVTINLRGGESEVAVNPGGEIRGREAANVLAAMSSFAADISKLTESSIKPLIASLNRAVTGFGDLLDNDGGGLIRDVRELTGNLSVMAGDITEDVPEIINNLNEFSQSINRSADRLGRILATKNLEKLDSVFADLETSSGNIAKLTSEFRNTRAGMDRILETIDSLLRDNRLDVDRSIIDLRHTVESVARNIDAINQNLEGASRNLFEFSRQIRQNPGLLLGGTPPVDEARQ